MGTCKKVWKAVKTIVFAYIYTLRLSLMECKLVAVFAKNKMETILAFALNLRSKIKRLGRVLEESWRRP